MESYKKGIYRGDSMSDEVNKFIIWYANKLHKNKDFCLEACSYTEGCFEKWCVEEFKVWLSDQYFEDNK